MTKSQTSIAELLKKIKRQRTLIASAATPYLTEVYTEQLWRYHVEIKRQAAMGSREAKAAMKGLKLK